MLGITGGAAIPAAQYLAVIQQALNHSVARPGDRGDDYAHGLDLGLDAFLKLIADSFLRFHLF